MATIGRRFFWGRGVYAKRLRILVTIFLLVFSKVKFTVVRSKKSGYDMATIFLGVGVRELLATIWLRYCGGGGVFAKRLRNLATIHLFDFPQSLLRLVKVKEWLRIWQRFFSGGGFQSFWLRYGYDTVG